MFSIEAIMSTNLITVPPSATLAEARALMQQNRIHHIPVLDGDQLTGLISLTNVLAATDSFLRDDGTRIDRCVAAMSRRGADTGRPHGP